jgi:hypothetical protein
LLIKNFENGINIQYTQTRGRSISGLSKLAKNPVKYSQPPPSADENHEIYFNQDEDATSGTILNYIIPALLLKILKGAIHGKILIEYKNMSAWLSWRHMIASK